MTMNRIIALIITKMVVLGTLAGAIVWFTLP